MAASLTSPVHQEPSSNESLTPEHQLTVDTIAAQTATPQDAPRCPVCQRTDEVRTIQAAFDLGLEPIAPPAMPTSNARMAPWIVGSLAIYLSGNFYLFIELGANARHPWPLVVQIVSYGINLLALVVGLVLTYLAVIRLVRADREVEAQYPTWERAVDNWNRLYYCLRDNAVIDPAQGRRLADDELRARIATAKQAPRTQRRIFAHGDIHD